MRRVGKVSVVLTSFSSGVRFLNFSPALLALPTCSPALDPVCASAKIIVQGVSDSFLGVSSRAFSFTAFSLAILAWFRAVLFGTFFTAGFLGFGFGLAGAFFAFGFGFGFRPTAFFPAAVLGPGFLGAAVLVLLAGVRPVCAFGRPTGFAVALVAYDRVATKHMRLDLEDGCDGLDSLLLGES